MHKRLCRKSFQAIFLFCLIFPDYTLNVIVEMSGIETVDDFMKGGQLTEAERDLLKEELKKVRF